MHSLLETCPFDVFDRVKLQRYGYRIWGLKTRELGEWYVKLRWSSAVAGRSKATFTMSR